MGMLSPLLQQATSVVAVRGEGSYLYDGEGQRYLDFTSGIGVTSTGHCHPRVVEAARRQVGQLIHGQYTTVLHPGLLALTERLTDLAPDPLDAVFYASAGTESIEGALRLARHATGRSNVIAFQGSFHGRTVGSLSLTTSKSALRAGLQPLLAGVHIAPFPYAYHYGWDEKETTRFCLRELDHLLETVSAPDQTAAVFLEPVLGEGGYVPANSAFVQGIRERCDRHGMLLVVDEIQTGIGRTGSFWGYEHYGATPDMVVTAKGLASGFPLSAFVAPRELMAKGWPGSQGGTYGGNAVACAAALATLDVIKDEGLVERAATLGARLRRALDEVAAEHPVIGEVRGVGLMVGTEFTDGALATRVRQECERWGLLMLPCGARGQVVRWIPPLVVTEQQIDEAVGIFAESVEKVSLGA